jgi:hypothetical protein
MKMKIKRHAVALLLLAGCQGLVTLLRAANPPAYLFQIDCPRIVVWLLDGILLLKSVDLNVVIYNIPFGCSFSLPALRVEFFDISRSLPQL